MKTFNVFYVCFLLTINQYKNNLFKQKLLRIILVFGLYLFYFQNQLNCVQIILNCATCYYRCLQVFVHFFLKFQNTTITLMIISQLFFYNWEVCKKFLTR